MLVQFAATVAVAALGSKLARHYKIPAGGIIGAMLAVALFNIITDAGVFPEELKPMIRICAGVYVGSLMTLEDLISLRSIAGASVVMVLGLLAMNLMVGAAISHFMGIDLLTSLLGSTPGGIQEMALIADDLGAATSKVAALQSTRLLVVLCIMPGILKAYCKMHGIAEQCPAPDKADGSPEPVKDSPKKYYIGLMRGLVVGGAAGMLLQFFGVPAGTMTGAMIGALCMGLLGHPVTVSTRFRRFTQAMSGAIIGAGIGRAELMELREMAGAAVILIASLIIGSFLIAYAVRKVSNLDMPTALFSCVAGGVADMSIIAAEMGADAPKVAAMQMLRLMAVILLFPSLISLVT